MHRAIASWLTEHPWRAVLASAFCGALSPWMEPFTVMACAIPVLCVLRFDAKTALAVAATAAAAAGWITYSATTPTPMSWVIAGIGVLFFSPALLALLLKRTSSMNLCFQVAVLGAAIVLGVIYLALADPAAVWLPLLNQLMDSMANAGVKIEGDRQVLMLGLARTLWGAALAVALATVFGGVLLGRWWDCLLREPGAFGSEFRRLQLGTTLGVTITGVFAFALLTDSALAGSLAWVAFIALAFQGLAAAHRSKAGGRLNRGWLAAIYLLLVVPLSMFMTVFVLAVWGFTDNWLRPRRPASL